MCVCVCVNSPACVFYRVPIVCHGGRAYNVPISSAPPSNPPPPPLPAIVSGKNQRVSNGEGGGGGGKEMGKGGWGELAAAAGIRGRCNAFYLNLSYLPFNARRHAKGGARQLIRTLGGRRRAQISLLPSLPPPTPSHLSPLASFPPPLLLPPVPPQLVIAKFRGS